MNFRLQFVSYMNSTLSIPLDTSLEQAAPVSAAAGVRTGLQRRACCSGATNPRAESRGLTPHLDLPADARTVPANGVRKWCAT